MLVIGNLTQDDFCERLTEELTVLNDEPVDFFPIEENKFPDGEFKLRLTGGYLPDSNEFVEPDELIKRMRSGEKITFVSRGTASENWDPQGLFVRTLFSLGALKTYGAHQDNICAVLPYYFFSRQHEVYREGEAHSAKTVRKAIKDELAGMLITVSAHNFRNEGEMDNRVWNMDATDSVMAYAQTLPLGNERYIVTPDSGQYSGKLRFPLAEALEAGTIAFGKERNRATGEIDVDVRNLEGLEHPEDVDIFMYDDELSTGGTLREDIDRCIRHGIDPKRIHTLAVHNKNAFNKKYGKNGAELVTETGAGFSASDTIYSGFAKFSVVPQLAEYIKRRFW